MELVNYLTGLVVRAKTDRRGVTIIEYGLLAALIAVALIAAMQSLTGGLSGTFSSITAKL
jgi:pilus assembly protein Flp/PilA